ncbi:MAG: tetratricopeptide repeat-containing protein, partial [Acidobacteria bacterium]
MASSLNNLAELQRRQGGRISPEPLYLRALDIWENVLGPSHPKVALGLGNLASFYLEEGKSKDAVRLLKR